MNTVEACRVAQLDRDRFNEYVSMGVYLCAPRTVPGRTRLFASEDLIALCLFSHMLACGISGDTAGNITRAAFRVLKREPNAALIACTLPAKVGGVGMASHGFEVADNSAIGRRSHHGQPLILLDIEQERQVIAARIKAA